MEPLTFAAVWCMIGYAAGLLVGYIIGRLGGARRPELKRRAF
jgi:membrane protein DedA with SNARE-associated domain